MEKYIFLLTAILTTVIFTHAYAETSFGVIKGGTFDLQNGQIQYEAKVDGEFAASDPSTGGVVRLQSGMTKQEVEEAAKKNEVAIRKNTKDEWKVGESLIILFVDNKFAKIKD